MNPVAPSLVIAAANAFIGVVEEGGNNRGQMVELFLSGVKQPPGEPWCAAFVHHVGYAALYNHGVRRSSWPLPATASCWELGEFARRNGILVKAPEFGDVFLQYKPGLGRFGHTGFIERVIEVRREGGKAVVECGTIEGNTSEGGSREGDATLRQVRTFCPADGDRFVRWVDVGIRRAA